MEFSKNRLVDDELPPGDTYLFTRFWVPEEEPPGGTTFTARQHMSNSPISRFCLNCLALMHYRQVTQTKLGWFWVFWVDSGRGIRELHLLSEY